MTSTIGDELDNKTYWAAHKDGESCAWASITMMFINEFDDPEDIPGDTTELAAWIKQQTKLARLKLLKEIRRSYPKKQALQGRAVSKLTLADIDRMIGEASIKERSEG